MPLKCPIQRKEYAARQYLKNRDKQWKNPDGSWKKPGSPEKRNEWSRRWYHSNKDAVSERRKEKIRQLREQRTGPCPICQSIEVLVWDHCHRTEEFRNYICQSCNLALGHARDNPQTLRKLAEYLECPKHLKND